MKKLYKNCHFAGKDELADMLVEDGRFTAIQAGIDAGDAEMIDLGGRLVVPPYVDPHLHLDYVYMAKGAGARNDSGTLFEGIQRWSETKAGASADELRQGQNKP